MNDTVSTTSAAAASPVDGRLATVAMVISLGVAVWAGGGGVRQRPPDRIQFIGLAVLEVALLALTVTALVALGGGDRPGEPGAFFGYLATLVCLPPLAWVLARMEPTRWGSGIVCAICLVTPVVAVRLQQTWEALGG